MAAGGAEHNRARSDDQRWSPSETLGLVQSIRIMSIMNETAEHSIAGMMVRPTSVAPPVFAGGRRWRGEVK